MEENVFRVNSSARSPPQPTAAAGAAATAVAVVCEKGDRRVGAVGVRRNISLETLQPHLTTRQNDRANL